VASSPRGRPAARRLHRPRNGHSVRLHALRCHRAGNYRTEAIGPRQVCDSLGLAALEDGSFSIAAQMGARTVRKWFPHDIARSALPLRNGARGLGFRGAKGALVTRGRSPLSEHGPKPAIVERLDVPLQIFIGFKVQMVPVPGL
jgi:hypothetical protein